MNITTQKILINIFGCLTFLSIPILSSPDFNSGRNMFVINPFLQDFFRYFLLLIYFYANYYLLLPLVSNKSKIGFVLVSVVVFLLILKVPQFVFPFEIQHFGQGKEVHPIPKKNFRIIDSGLFQFLFLMGLSYLLKINERFELIKQEKQSAEISFLKAQINPHFLFNTLNSLYALTVTKSDEAPNAVLKLSGMMRYVVTESSQEYVPLSKEINYINDYISLQKLRMNDDVNFSFNFVGDVNGIIIAPLILIPFIENAFKYGLNPDEESEIKIEIAVVDSNLTLVSKNKIVVHELPEDLKTEKGISNTKKRLDIIYPNKYLLKIAEVDNEFIVHLNINLA